MLLTVPTAPTASALRSWQSATAPYRASSTARAALQLLTTLLPLGALIALMYAMLDVSYWVTLALAVPAFGAEPSSAVDAPTAERFASLALACVHKEYPNKIAHVLNSPVDVQAPRALTARAREQRHLDLAELFAFAAPAVVATPTPDGWPR